MVLQSILYSYVKQITHILVLGKTTKASCHNMSIIIRYLMPFYGNYIALSIQIYNQSCCYKVYELDKITQMHFNIMQPDTIQTLAKYRVESTVLTQFQKS